MGEAGLSVRDIGEFDLIDRLTAMLPCAARASGESELGIGDDAAIWNPAAGRSIVITTDALIEHVHFRLDWTDWTSLGHKMLAVNISDIAAMGARPCIATIVLGLTGKELVADVESLYHGLGSLAAIHNVVIAGGDVVRVPNDVTLSVTLLGGVRPGHAMTRTGARPGDLIVVSGTLGASAAGMAILEREVDPGTTGPLLIAAHLRPNPRVALGLMLNDHGATAAMDLSDGLLGDLPKILKASGVSAEIEIDQVPIAPAVRALFPDEFEKFALRGGEDYELLLTVPHDRFEELHAGAVTLGATLKSIGRIVPADPEPNLALLRNGAPVDFSQEAFDHFG